MASEYADYQDEGGPEFEANFKWSMKNHAGATPLQRWKNFNRHQKGCTGGRPDSRGSMRHASKRVKQSNVYDDAQEYQVSSPSDPSTREKHSPARDYSAEGQECTVKSPAPALGVAFSYPVELKWRWPSDADYPSHSFGDSSRSLVKKERAVFVGCIPDGLNNIVEVLQSLMEMFLERFDFVPAMLGEIQLVNVVKDYAFLELANEKVAQIVLAANQLDLFEWGSNGCYFNIEGCHGTYTSARPLIEYMPLRPARVLFVGNIPKSCWQEDYLEEFFSRILWASDGPSDSKLVVCVYLLPESCDAYLELASEFIADALIYKCTKSPQLLKDLGEEVFVCRDLTSTPMMSRHESTICPQRSLFIGLSAREEDMKIDCIRKVFDAVLPLISRKVNHPAYLEYISVLPGKDYAFFQFNSETTVDAIMDEYIENTHLFSLNHVNLFYIILRPPEYVRPGARFYSEKYPGRGGQLGSRQNSHQTKWMQRRSVSVRDSDRRRQLAESNPRSRTSCLEQLENEIPVPRSKKADCVMSMGISPPPVAVWDGLSSNGENVGDPDCMIIIEGITKGISYKLLRGALNELFERELSHSGLLEVGMLLVRFLDRDEGSDLVISLPSAEFVHALLSLRKVFLVAGHEVRLLPKGTRRSAYPRVMPGIMHSDEDEMSCSSEEAEEWGDAHSPSWNRRRVRSGTADQYYPHPNFRRDPDFRRQGANHEWGSSERRMGYKDHFHSGPRNFSRATEESFCRQGSTLSWNPMEGKESMHFKEVNRPLGPGARVIHRRRGMFRTTG